jgi:2-hydroxychromene-2-carboxylate isomerase
LRLRLIGRDAHTGHLSIAGDAGMACCIDFHFDFSSPYGFLAAMKIEAVVKRASCRLTWRPFLLGAVYQRFGQSPLEHPLKRRYVLDVDVPRAGRRDGLDIKVPAGFPQHSLPAARIFYWIEAQAPEKASGFAKAAYRKYWLEGSSTANVDVAVDVAATLGFDRARVAAGMQDPAIKLRLARENEQAIASGVFGSPFIIVDGEPFWGGDRLDAVAERLAACNR